MSYSDGVGISYCMADSIYGPYEYKGRILDEVNSGTNHSSIVEYKGQWYLFYHTADPHWLQSRQILQTGNIYNGEDPSVWLLCFITRMGPYSPSSSLHL